MLAALLALVLSGASAAVAARDFDPSRFVPLAMTVLKVEALNPDGRLNVGTAITVAPGVVVTSCHVTRNATSVRVVKRAGQWPVTAQYADAEHDLCFLAVPTWPGKPVTFAPEHSLRLYQPVVAMGFTRGVDMSLTAGEITGLHEHDGGRIIQATSSFSSGASGGALLDPNGRLLGVLTFRLKGNTDHFFSVPASWIAVQLPVAPDRYQPIEPAPGQRAFWEEDSCCLPFFMRVGSLLAQEKWADLLRLAEQWIFTAPDDADAWFTKGMAQARLQHAGDALPSLTRATELAPRHADAWYELGAASLEVKDIAGAGRARDMLAEMHSDLAPKLARMLPDTATDRQGTHMDKEGFR